MFVNINVTDIERFQYIQNRAARIILKARKFDHATPLLRDLHWLPVSKRILFKVALIVFKSIHNLSPQYISNMFSFLTQSNYSLRSRTDPLLLKIPKINSKKCEQTISFAGPKIWNGLPLEIRSCTTVQTFKNKLKTYLFSL